MKRKTRRIIEICILVLLLGYLVLFLVDYNRSKNSLKPLLVISTREKEYDDGYVKEYVSIGWIYREYRRETITDNELAPIWSKIKLDDALIRDNEDDLPELEEHNIPNNPNRDAKVEDVLFFYDGEELLGTYKCLNSETDCDIAKNAILPYDEDEFSNYPMSIIDKRYVFIEDAKSKNTPVEEKIIYLLDLKANRLIAKYEDVRFTYAIDKQGYIDTSKYIVKKNGKWGIDQVILGKVSNKLPYEYDYISYNTNTKLYILLGVNKWQTLNIETNEYSTSFDKQINATYKNGDNYLIGINTYNKDTFKTDYALYNLEGTNIINKTNIDYLNVYTNYIVYTNNFELHIISYTGEELITPLKIYFNSYREQGSSIMPFYIKEVGEEYEISIPKRNYIERMQDEFFYKKDTWEKTRERLNVFESGN